MIVSAAGEIESKLPEGIDLSEIEEALPEIHVREILEQAMQGEGTFEGDEWKNQISEMLLSCKRELLPTLLRFCGYAVLCLTLSMLSSDDGVGTLGQSLLHVSALLLPIRQIALLTENTAKILGRLSSLCGAVTPTVSALLLAEGSVKRGAVGQAVSLFVMEKLISGAQSLLLPLLKATAVLILLSAVTSNLPLDRLCRLPLSFVKWSCGIAFAAFLGMLTVKGLPAARYDGVTMRAAKYAVEKLVPVVGGIFKETTDTLIGSVLLLKGAMGTVAILGLLSILLAPITEIALTMWGYKLIAAFLEPLGDMELSKNLTLLCEVLLTLLIVLLTTGAVLIIFLAALTMAGGVL